MKLNKKTLAILAGVTMAMSSTAFAATSADSFSDVPKGHWSYDAIDYLAKNGVIEGMGDSTFQGNRSMTRYEMAAIVARAMQHGATDIGDKAVLDKLSAEYAPELAKLQKQVNANSKAIKQLNEKTDKFKVWGMVRAQIGDDNGLQSNYKDVHPTWGNWNNGSPNGDYNNRFYMDFEAAMKVNPYATARFTIEKNARFRDSEYRASKFRTQGGAAKPISGIDSDSLEGDDNHSGAISNIWVELQLGKNHNWYTNIGRKWNGIGMQNLMLGGQIDGIATYHPIENGHGWWFSAQYWKPSSDWTTGTLTNAYTKRDPIMGTLDFWGPLGKYIDVNLAYSRVVQHHCGSMPVSNDTASGLYSGARNFYGIDVKAKLFKDFSVTGSYLKSDAKTGDWSTLGYLYSGANKSWAVRFDYRGTDLNKPGTWGLYARWNNLGAVADVGHDDEWSTREPTYVNGVRGWSFGFKMVPFQNVEWETYWAPHLLENKDANYAGGAYRRHILRSWLDFHF